MATINELTVSAARRIQLERFEPIEYEATLRLDLEPDDDPDEVFDQASGIAETMVERRLATRLAAFNFDEVGPSVPAIKAVVRDFAPDLDDETVTGIAETAVANRARDE
jgi:hypothetical protein